MRNVRIVLVILLLAFSAAAKEEKKHSLMPVPAEIDWHDGRLSVTKDFSVGFVGPSDARLKAYAGRVIRRLEGRTVFLTAGLLEGNSSKAKLVVEIGKATNRYPKLGDDESYHLRINGSGARLKANTGYGAMRGLETLLQLLNRDKSGFYFPAVTIKDKPRFPWRGLLIDVARHFQPLHVLKRNIDGMAAVKMNLLHWHLTEDQGWRLHIDRYPGLTEIGSHLLVVGRASVGLGDGRKVVAAGVPAESDFLAIPNA